MNHTRTNISKITAAHTSQRIFPSCTFYCYHFRHSSRRWSISMHRPAERLILHCSCECTGSQQQWPRINNVKSMKREKKHRPNRWKIRKTHLDAAAQSDGPPFVNKLFKRIVFLKDFIQNVYHTILIVFKT